MSPAIIWYAWLATLASASAHVTLPRAVNGSVTDRTGNWTSLTCSDPAVSQFSKFTPDQRWGLLDCDNAWSDALAVWRNFDRGRFPFVESIYNTYHGPEMVDCGDIGSAAALSNCGLDLNCSADAGSGPAGAEIMNSFVSVHLMYNNYDSALFNLIDSFTGDFANLTTNFALASPTAPDSISMMNQIFINLIGVGAVAAAIHHFNTSLIQQDFYTEHPQNLTDGLYGAISPIMAAIQDRSARANISDIRSWTTPFERFPKIPASDVLLAWENLTETAAQHIFDGSDEGIQQLTTLISNGRMLAGSKSGDLAAVDKSVGTDFRDPVRRAAFSFAIPALWSAAATGAFVMDSGFDCSHQDPLAPARMSADTAHAAGGCYNNTLYYLVSPDAGGQTFSLPPGLELLAKGGFGGLEVGDLINGSLRTFESNGNKNGAPLPNITSMSVLDSLLSEGITAPGYVRLPVCGPDEAAKNRGSGDRYATYPCDKVASQSGSASAAARPQGAQLFYWVLLFLSCMSLVI